MRPFNYPKMDRVCVLFLGIVRWWWISFRLKFPSSDSAVQTFKRWTYTNAL